MFAHGIIISGLVASKTFWLGEIVRGFIVLGFVLVVTVLCEVDKIGFGMDINTFFVRDSCLCGSYLRCLVSTVCLATGECFVSGLE